MRRVEAQQSLGELGVFASSTEARICGVAGGVFPPMTLPVFASSTEARICGPNIVIPLLVTGRRVRLLDGGAYLRLVLDEVVPDQAIVFASSTEARICGIHYAGFLGVMDTGVRLLDGGAYLRLNVGAPPAPSDAAGVRLLDGGAYLRHERRRGAVRRGRLVFASSTEARICGPSQRLSSSWCRSLVFASSTEARICGFGSTYW